MASRIQLRRDTAAAWTSANPTLSSAELGVETDTGKFKIGDGASTWTALAYAAGDPTASGVAAVLEDAILTAGPAEVRAAAEIGAVTVLQPGDNIQAAINAATAGDHLVLAAGTHNPAFVETTQWDGETCWVGFQINKQITLEIAEGAVLTNPDAINGIRQTPEIVFDQGRWKNVPSLESASGIEVRADGVISATGSVIVTVATLSGSTPATYTRSDTGATTYPVVLDQWDSLGNNVSFRFTTANASNSSVGDSFYVSRTAEPIYHIRIGTGTHATAIDGVRITGLGKIMANATGQEATLSEVADLSSLILAHGRVTGLVIEYVTLEDYLERPILIQGEHTGEDYTDSGCNARLIAASYVHGTGIYFAAGTEYSVEGAVVRNVRFVDSRPILLGHPAHRGAVIGVEIVGNDIDVVNGAAGIETNFRLRDFVVANNRIRSTLYGVTLRRGPSFGSVVGNSVRDGGVPVYQSNATTFPSPRNVLVLANSSENITGVVDYAIGLGANFAEQIGAVWSKAFIGNRSGTNTQMAVCHSDLLSSANSFALMQTATGATYINAASGQTINFRINNSSAGVINSSGHMTFSGRLAAQIDSYADDAAADAALTSGQLYRTTAGGRTVFQKP